MLRRNPYSHRNQKSVRNRLSGLPRRFNSHGSARSRWSELNKRSTAPDGRRFRWLRAAHRWPRPWRSARMGGPPADARPQGRDLRGALVTRAAVFEEGRRSPSLPTSRPAGVLRASARLSAFVSVSKPACRAAADRKLKPSEVLSSEGFRWLRGLDLNQRPLGYEGKSSHHDNQDEPTHTNDDTALPNRLVVPFPLISVGLLHSRFIAREGARTLRSGVPCRSRFIPDGMDSSRDLNGINVPQSPCVHTRRGRRSRDESYDDCG